MISTRRAMSREGCMRSRQRSGERAGTRTQDLQIKSPLLYQLSYALERRKADGESGRTIERRASAVNRPAPHLPGFPRCATTALSDVPTRAERRTPCFQTQPSRPPWRRAPCRSCLLASFRSFRPISAIWPASRWRTCASRPRRRAEGRGGSSQPRFCSCLASRRCSSRWAPGRARSAISCARISTG